MAGAALLVVVATTLNARRDLGAALRPAGPGPTSAGPLLSSPVGLVLRLNRGVLLGWVLGVAVFAAVYGPVLGEADEFLEQMPVLTDFLPDAAAGGGVRLFASILVTMGAIVACVPSGQVLTRLCGDEQAGRTGLLLTGGISRLRWYVGHVLVAILTATAVVLTLGLVLGGTAVRVTGDGRLLPDVLVACLATIPAIAVVLGVATALAGWWPQRVALVWLLVALCVAVFYFAELMDWPQWLTGLSPFSHLAARPAESAADGAAWLVQSCLAVGLVLVGAVDYRRRAIHG